MIPGWKGARTSEGGAFQAGVAVQRPWGGNIASVRGVQTPAPQWLVGFVGDLHVLCLFKKLDCLLIVGSWEFFRCYGSSMI